MEEFSFMGESLYLSKMLILRFILTVLYWALSLRDVTAS